MGNLKVCLVDDEKDFVTTLGERLELRGFDVQIATDGDAALEMIEADPPNVRGAGCFDAGLGGSGSPETGQIIEIKNCRHFAHRAGIHKRGH